MDRGLIEGLSMTITGREVLEAMGIGLGIGVVLLMLQVFVRAVVEEVLKERGIGQAKDWPPQPGEGEAKKRGGDR